MRFELESSDKKLLRKLEYAE